MKERYTNEMIRILRSLQNIDYITPDDIPNIDLYMDQVTTFMDEHLNSSKRFEEDKILTKTMINNYTKNNLLPPSKKKKYTPEHMILLIYIYYFKNFLSINDIQQILSPITEHFFSDESDLSFKEIYDQIVKLQMENMNSQAKDIIRKLKKSSESFADIKDPEERDLLKTFSFICMLSFDVWVKKTLIENIIDEPLRKK